MASIMEGPRYQKVRDELKADPIIQDMAGGLRGVALIDIAHIEGHPRSEFMQAANNEYHIHRKGKIYGHLGAVAEALLQLLKEEKDGERTRADHQAT